MNFTEYKVSVLAKMKKNWKLMVFLLIVIIAPRILRTGLDPSSEEIAKAECNNLLVTELSNKNLSSVMEVKSLLLVGNGIIAVSYGLKETDASNEITYCAVIDKTVLMNPDIHQIRQAL